MVVQVHVQSRRDLQTKFSLLMTGALECPFEVRELFEEGGVMPTRIRLRGFYGQVCMLPASDFANRSLAYDELNQALCALLAYLGDDDLRALGRSCK